MESSLYADNDVSESSSTSTTPSNSFTRSCDDIQQLSYMQSSLGKSLKLHPNASLNDLKIAINQCKVNINESGQCSEERKWYVRYLVELRLRVQQLEDSDDNVLNSVSTLGHHFEVCNNVNMTKKQFCDHCCGVIWNVLQGSYICKDCGYICHFSCVDKVGRVCAHIIATEKGGLLMNICPTAGLASQGYKCAECKVGLSFKIRGTEPRLCDYFGQYFCSRCHWNKTCEIPARIVHNWDWEKRPVSQSAYQLLTLTKQMPLINLELANEKLFSFVTELDYIRKVRCDLKLMRKYLVECQTGCHIITPEILTMSETPQLYSIENLEMVKNNLFETKLSILRETCREHITYCEMCTAKAYRCELCKNKETIFPFDSSAVGCAKCNTYFHRFCWVKRHQTCPKCIRIESRNKNQIYSDDILEL